MIDWQHVLGETRVIPVVAIDNPDQAEPLAEALLKGGIDVIEVTFRTAAAGAAIARIAARFPEMNVGAGTVLTVDLADQALNAGATFGVAPGLNPDVVEHFGKRNALFIPGVVTPSEIERALGLGCKLLKFFPAEPAGGVDMLKALAGPYAFYGIKFCATGGLNLENMKDYLALPTVAAIGGSWIATRQQIACGEWNTITRQAEETLSRAA